MSTALRMAHQYRQPVRLTGHAPWELDDALEIDLQRMNEVIAFDEQSRIVHVQAGKRVHALEDELRRRGLSLGAHSSARDHSVGAWLSLGAPGARDADDDPVDQLVAGLEAVLPDGREVHIRPAPRRAVGPDLVSAFVGARGRLGVIVGAHIVARLRVESDPVGFLFPTREGARSALAWIRGRGVRPIRAYLSDVPEGSALRLKLERNTPLAEAYREVARATAKEFGGVRIDERLELPTPAPSDGVGPSQIVEELAARLDPRGILSDARHQYQAPTPKP